MSEVIYTKWSFEEPHENPYRRKAIQVPVMSEIFPYRWFFENAHENPYW
jgi:hypothetical protein